MPIRRLSIVGGGNVGFHLFKAFSSLPYAMVMTTHEPDGVLTIHPDELPNPDILCVAHVNSRSLEDLPDYSDLIIIAVKDDAIAEVAARLKGKAHIIAHTSGSVPIDVLSPYAENYGVVYPLQTFSKNKELDYFEIPYFIEGSSEAIAKKLDGVAHLISQNVYAADSEKRKHLHIAAVFACNFSNHLVGIADDLLKEADLDYRVLLPLIRETVAKLEFLPPHDAQTGPAVRNDRHVMDTHKQMLASHPAWKAIYSLISESIVSTHEGYASSVDNLPPFESRISSDGPVIHNGNSRHGDAR